MGRIHRKLNVFGGKEIKQLDVLFDTGASQSVIEQRIANEICIQIPLLEPIKVILPNNGQKEVTHTCVFHTTIDDSQISDTALIMEGLGDIDMVIGIQTMRRYNMEIKINENNEEIIISKKTARVIYL